MNVSQKIPQNQVKAESYREKIEECLKACEEGGYIFHGSSKQYSKIGCDGTKEDSNSNEDAKSLENTNAKSCNNEDENTCRVVCSGKEKLCSTLYRNCKKTIWDEHFTPFRIEGEILERAKRSLRLKDENIQILTELRHYGQKLALLDFTHSLYVALFFACSEDFHKDGELVIFKVPAQDCDEALRLNPDLHEALLNRGLGKGKLGELFNRKNETIKAIEWQNNALADLDELIRIYEKKTNQIEGLARAKLTRGTAK